MIRSVLAMALVLFPVTGAIADPDATKPAKPVVDPDKQRCKTSAETGSLVPKRVCHTNAEWAEIAKQGRADAEQYRNVMASSRGGN